MNINSSAKEQSLPLQIEDVLSPKDLYFLQDIVDEIYRITPLVRFKALFARASKKSKDEADLDSVLQQHIQQDFRQIMSHMNTLLYHTKRFSREQKELVGQWLHQEFFPFCLLGTWPERSLNKPQRIAGDHFTIKQIYQNGNKEKQPLGQLVNECFFAEPACKAVQNRKDYMQQKLLTMLDNRPHDEPLNVCSIASGPAEELFAVYQQLGKEGAGRLKAVGIDIDKRACAAVDDQIAAQKLSRNFSTHSHDIFKLDPLPHYFADQDLVYSMGLFDYFKDRLAVKVINTLYKMLKPGGTLVIGNFHISCDSRVFLDYLLDWPLIYRTEEDMQRLFAKSDFGDSEVTIDFEAEGVNMLVYCTRQ